MKTASNIPLLLGLAVAFGAAMLLAGCSETSGPSGILGVPPAVPPAFSEMQASLALRRGPNSIQGSSAQRLANGQMASCAGASATLIPVTPYARWRMATLYGGSTSIPIAQAPHLPPNPAFAQAVLQTPCDQAGHFRFTQVADGDFFLTTRIALPGGAISVQQPITLQGGGTIRINLAALVQPGA